MVFDQGGDIMALNLIPIKKGSDSIDIHYKNFLPSRTQQMVGAVCTIHDRILYMAYKYSTLDIFLYTMDLFTGVITYRGQLSSPPGVAVGNCSSICVDGNYIFASMCPNNVIAKYDLDTLTLINIIQPSPANNISGRMILWKDQLVYQYTANVLMFVDTMTGWMRPKRSSISMNFLDIVCGEKYIIGSNVSTSGGNLLIYDIENDIFLTKSFTSNALGSLCYSDGKFYFAQPGYLSIIDEETLESTTIVTSWPSNIVPRSIQCDKGNVFVTLSNSNKLFIYNIKENQSKTVILPWNMWDYNTAHYITTEVYNGYIYIPYITLAKCGGFDSTKYAIGNAINFLSYEMNVDHSIMYEFDDRFVRFTNGYATLNDGIIDHTITTETGSNIKVVNVDKTEYNEFKNIIMRKEEL